MLNNKIKASACKTAYLEIGDILFNITCPPSINIAEPDVAYAPFFQKSRNHRAMINIQLTLDLKDMPATVAYDKIFEAEPISLYKNDGFIISLHMPKSDEPYRMAWIQKDFHNIVVYCNRYMQSKGDLDGILQNPICYPLDQIILMLYLANEQGGLLHAGGVYMDNRVFLFPGKSGAGKSTLCRQFTDDKDFSLINDDRILIRKDPKNYMAYGTPWPGENRYTENIGLPVGGIFFIHKSSEDRIRPLNRQEAFEKLMPVLSIPWYEPDLVSNYLNFCELLVDQMPVFELSFKPDKNISYVFKKFICNL